MDLSRRLSKVLGIRESRVALFFRKKPENSIFYFHGEDGKLVASVRMLNNPKKFALIDDKDVDLIKIGRWSQRSNGYAAWKLRIDGKTRAIYMHRFILCGGREIDHKNRDRMDNRRENLRRTTHRNNISNQSKREGCSSRFKGVYWKKRDSKWGTSFKHPILNKTVSLGTFESEIKAAAKYNETVIKFRGKFAVLNEL